MFKYLFWFYCAKNLKFRYYDGELAILAAISIASTILLGLLAPKPESQPIQTQQKDTPSAEYGFAIPIGIKGNHTYAGNMFWVKPLKEVDTTVSSSGKGFFGAPEAQVSEFSYFASCAYVFAYVGDYDAFSLTGIPFDTLYSLIKLKINDTEISTSHPNIKFYAGSYSQGVDPTILLDKPDSPAYRGYCYIVFSDFPVKDYGNGFFSVTAILNRGGNAALHKRELTDRVLTLAKATNPISSSRFPQTLTIKNELTTNQRRIQGSKLASSGQSYKDALDQVAYLGDFLGFTTSINDRCTQTSPINTSITATAQAIITDYPVLNVFTQDNRLRQYDPSLYGTIESRFLGASPEGDYLPLTTVEAFDVTEIPNEIKVNYADTKKDYNTSEVSYRSEYHTEDYRTDIDKSITLDFALTAEQAREIVEAAIAQIHDSNRQFSFSIAPSHYGNLFLGQIINLPYNQNTITVKIIKIARGIDFTQEVTATLYSNKFDGLVSYTDPTFETEEVLPPVISILTPSFKVFDLPNENVPSGSNKYGVWVAIDDISHKDSSSVFIWYRINNGAWVNTLLAATRRGRFGSLVATPPIGSPWLVKSGHPLETHTTLTFDSITPSAPSPWMGSTQNELEFTNRVRNKGITFDATRSYFMCYEQANLIALNTYKLNNIQELGQFASTVFDEKALAHGTTAGNLPNRFLQFAQNSQVWIELPDASLGQLVEFTLSNFVPDVSPPNLETIVAYQGASYKAPYPNSRRVRRLLNLDWVIAWEANEVYDTPWEDGTGGTLTTVQSYTVDIYDVNLVLLRSFTTTNLYTVYSAANQLLDLTQTVSTWSWSVRASYTNGVLGLSSPLQNTLNDYT